MFNLISFWLHRQRLLHHSALLTSPAKVVKTTSNKRVGDPLFDPEDSLRREEKKIQPVETPPLGLSRIWEDPEHASLTDALLKGV